MTEKSQTTIEEKALGTAVAAYVIAQAAATKLPLTDQKEMADLLRGFLSGLDTNPLGLSSNAVAVAQKRMNETAEMLEGNASN